MLALRVRHNPHTPTTTRARFFRSPRRSSTGRRARCSAGRQGTSWPWRREVQHTNEGCCCWVQWECTSVPARTGMTRRRVHAIHTPASAALVTCSQTHSHTATQTAALTLERKRAVQPGGWAKKGTHTHTHCGATDSTAQRAPIGCTCRVGAGAAAEAAGCARGTRHTQHHKQGVALLRCAHTLTELWRREGGTCVCMGGTRGSPCNTHGLPMQPCTTPPAWHTPQSGGGNKDAHKQPHSATSQRGADSVPRCCDATYPHTSTRA
jgi:hypothetical protein